MLSHGIRLLSRTWVEHLAARTSGAVMLGQRLLLLLESLENDICCFGIVVEQGWLGHRC